MRDLGAVAPSASAWEVRAPYYSQLAERIVRQLPPDVERWTLVAHSAAGGLLPAIAAALGERAEAAVFVDAILPHPGQSWLETAPPRLRSALVAASGGGVAPRWTDWFGPEALMKLLPDAALRAEFDGEIHAAPSGYLVEPAPPSPANWPLGACAYLQLGEGYAAEAEAAGRSWLVERLPLHHLAMLTAPDMVAAAIRRLATTAEQ